MADILDLIDHAIDDYLSGDAMRWTPEPPEPPSRGHPVYGLRQPELTDWQARTFAAHLMDQLGAALRPRIAELGRALTAFIEHVGPLFPQPPRSYDRTHHARPARHPVRYKPGRRA